MPLTTLIHSHKKEKKLLSHMSDNFKSRVKSSPNTFSLQQFMSENLLQTIHYSWFPYYFKTLACEHKQALLINILSDQTVDKINSYFKHKSEINRANFIHKLVKICSVQ